MFTAASKYAEGGRLPRTEQEMAEGVVAVRLHVISQVEGSCVVIDLRELTSEATETTGAYIFVIKPT